MNRKVFPDKTLVIPDRLVVGVDIGKGKDESVKCTWKKKPNGKYCLTKREILNG